MKKITIYILLILFSVASSLQAIPAYPFPIKITQADGTELTVKLKGDEFRHYHTTEDGYRILRDERGIFHYATRTKAGTYERSPIRVSEIKSRTKSEKSFVRSLTPRPNLSSENSRNRSSRAPSSADVPQKTYPRTGSPKSLVILVNFSDIAFTIASPQTAFTNLLNEPGYSTNGGTGSARDYFRDNSMGTFDPEFDVVGPYTLPQPAYYYGNNTSDFDTNPRQMVIDACALANADVDFTQYDADNDGTIDNVFIYYAGYNEAEGAPAYTVWPHRWRLADKSTKFDNKAVYDYACTSELRGNSGGNMCGVGTFCHEFGHVLGLVDYYDTEDSNQYTMSSWNIMDEGGYNNSGRTPPYYSAYDRFYLDWLTPTEIKTPGQLILDTLSTSNQAYLITANGNHNLDGADPDPVEFFMLENRQKKGWDSYLLGHGLLVTRIYYNSTTWAANKPNNDINAMGVDIMEADGVANTGTRSGDPFPGTSNVRNYNPILRNGTLIGKGLTEITETNGIIYFTFMGGNKQMVPPTALEATKVTIGSFIANWTPQPDSLGNYNEKGYYMNAYSISSGTSSVTENFSKGLTPSPGWIITGNALTTTLTYSGDSIPAIQLNKTGELIETENYVRPVTSLSFVIKSMASKNGYLIVEAYDKTEWIRIDSIPVTLVLNTTKNYSFSISDNYIKFRLTNYKGTQNISIDDITAGFSENISYATRNKWVPIPNNFNPASIITDTISNLSPNQIYNFVLISSNKTMNPDGLSIAYEKVSSLSNEISVTTLEDKIGNIFRAKTDGTMIILVPNMTDIIRVYNSIGQQIYGPVKPNSTIVELSGLPRQQVLIIQVGTKRIKTIL